MFAPLPAEIAEVWVIWCDVARDSTCGDKTLQKKLGSRRNGPNRAKLPLFSETGRQPKRPKFNGCLMIQDFTCAGLVLEQPFRTKWGSIVKNCGKIAILLVPGLSWSNPFARNEGRSSKTGVKLRLCRTCPGATLSHEMRVDAQKLR